MSNALPGDRPRRPISARPTFVWVIDPFLLRGEVKDAEVVLIVGWSPRRDSNPRPAAYKAAALPLSHRGERMGIGLMEMVGPAGFEPAASCSRSRCATRLRYGPSMAPPARVELATCHLRNGCSAAEIQGRWRGNRCGGGVRPRGPWRGRPGRARWARCSGAADAPWGMVVGTAGFEPAASSPPDWRAPRLRYAPVVLAGATGFEPATSGFGDRRSSV